MPHFDETLGAAHFDQQRAVTEWVAFQNYAAKALLNHPARQLLSSIFKFKKLEFPKLCLLAEHIIAI